MEIEIPCIIRNVTVIRSGPHGGYAIVSIELYGYVRQDIYVDPEIGDDLKMYIEQEVNAWECLRGPDTPKAPAVMLTIRPIS